MQILANINWIFDGSFIFLVLFHSPLFLLSVNESRCSSASKLCPFEVPTVFDANFRGTAFILSLGIPLDLLHHQLLYEVYLGLKIGDGDGPWRDGGRVFTKRCCNVSRPITFGEIHTCGLHVAFGCCKMPECVGRMTFIYVCVSARR